MMKRNDLWYAVQTEGYDAWDNGSTRWREALVMAHSEARKNGWADIAMIDVKHNYCCGTYHIVKCGRTFDMTYTH